MSNLWPEKSDSPAGKGDKPRPYSVPRKQFDKAWERIFGREENKKQNDSEESNGSN